MYINVLQCTSTYSKSTGKYYLHFDKIRTRNRCSSRRVASGPCRPLMDVSQAPKWTSPPPCQPNLQKTDIDSFALSSYGVQVYLLCLKDCKKWICQFWAARAPHRSMEVARPGPRSPATGGHRRRTDSASWPEFADYL